VAVQRSCFPLNAATAAAPGAPRFAVYYCGRPPGL